LGKSRLVAETTAYARSCGFRVLVGACFSQDRTSPFAPIVDLLRVALNGLGPDEVRALIRPFARELAPLLPDLLPSGGGAGLRIGVDLDSDRRQLFVALAPCLLAVGPSSPNRCAARTSTPSTSLSRTRERGSWLASAESLPSPRRRGGGGEVNPGGGSLP